MFKIYDGRTDFYQWDLDRKLIVGDKTIKEVHFCNRTGECSLIRNVYEVNGMFLVDVPNVLLQKDWDIRVYGFDANYTKHNQRFNVITRTRPENYVYTDEELKTWEQLEERIDEIEENGVSEEQISTAVEKYLDENGVEVDVDLSNYYTKEETDKKIADAATGEVDLSGYYTKDETDTAIEQAVAAIEIPEAKEEVYVGANAPTDTNVKLWVDTDENVEYALKADIPDTTGFITEAQATELINEAIGVIENGTY